MANIKKWLEAFESETGEKIEAVVIGMHDNDPKRWSPSRVAPSTEGKVLSREDGMAILDEEYNNGYGGADCYPMYAWSKSWVCFIGEYDGATGLSRVPRNPVDCNPCFNCD